MADDLASFAAMLRKLGQDINGPLMRAAMRDIGKAAERELANAARRDLGDGRFSGWSKAPALTVEAKPTEPGVLELVPAPRTAGPWTVATYGRRKGHKRTAKRSNTGWGATRGKGTFDDGLTAIDRTFDAVAEKAVIDRIEREFNSG